MMAVQVAMSGARKAAILLLTLGEDPSSEVCKHLREEEIEAIVKELAALGTVPAETGERVLDEFNALASKNGFAGQGSVEYARRVLDRAKGTEASQADSRSADHEGPDRPPGSSRSSAPIRSSSRSSSSPSIRRRSR